MKKKLLLTSLIALGTMSGLAACNSGKTNVGILLPVEHVALDTARKGFIAGLEENGFKDGEKINIKYYNAGGSASDLQTQAKELIDTCDISLGVATGSAQALLSAETNGGYTKPLLFTAVTDAVDAGLVKTNDNTEGFVCGTIDANPVDAQISLLKEVDPTASKLGIIYTQSETNSEVQADQAKVAAEAKGMTVDIKTCTNSSDIKSTATSLAQAGVDAIYVPTDNNIAANMNAIKSAADENNVFVIAGEENMLLSGGHFTLSIDYYALGFKTGEMAASILKGEKKPTDFKINAVPASDCAYVYNSKNLTDSGLSIPASVLSAHNWKDISE